MMERAESMCHALLKDDEPSTLENELLKPLNANMSKFIKVIQDSVFFASLSYVLSNILFNIT